MHSKGFTNLQLPLYLDYPQTDSEAKSIINIIFISFDHTFLWSNFCLTWFSSTAVIQSVFFITNY